MKHRIQILPDNLANQIAAGEVVERPASVVKELIENSIDAGATRIQIDIELGGRRLIRIGDDGHGMFRDDAILAFERHATSKIRSVDDLGRIATLGFRGEALASIASVAKVELITKVDDDAIATRVVIEGGRLIDVKDAARDRGTTIAVRDIFFNTPARRKFMRSEATENFHLTNIATHYALAHPEIAFTLTNNGRDVIRAAAAKTLKERAFQLFGGEMIESLLPINGGREYVAKVSGFVSAPRERRTTRDSQFFFVNDRFVKDRVIAEGLREGYRSVLPHGIYPVAFLFLEMPVEEIDVNVHPAKTEVRFRRSEAVKDVIAEAVRAALDGSGVIGDRVYTKAAEVIEARSTTDETLDVDLRPAVDSDDVVRKEETEQITIEYPDDGHPFMKEAIERGADLDQSAFVSRMDAVSVPEPNAESPDSLNADLAERRDEKLSDNGQLTLPPVDNAIKYVKSVEPDSISHTKIRPLGQMHDSFIVAVDDEGLLLIDQHVAHERILFDKFRVREGSRRIESQNLLLPETFDLSPAQSEGFDSIAEALDSLGFGLMRLSGRTIAIKSIPTDLAAAEARNLFAEILETVGADKRSTAKETLRDDIAASLACKAAIKINMKLTDEKMRWLIDRLLHTSSPTTCPHGRPVILRLSMHDIERGFHRV